MKNIGSTTTSVTIAPLKTLALGLICGALLAIAVVSIMAQVHVIEIGRQDNTVAVQRSTQNWTLPDLDETRPYRRSQPTTAVAAPSTAGVSQLTHQEHSVLAPSDICGPSLSCARLIEQNVWDTGLSSDHNLPTSTMPGRPY